MGEWKGLDTGRMPVFLGYDQTERMIAALLDRAAQWQPDAVVGIARGGLVPATMAAGILALPLAMIGFERASGVTQWIGAPASGGRILSGGRRLQHRPHNGRGARGAAGRRAGLPDAGGGARSGGHLLRAGPVARDAVAVAVPVGARRGNAGGPCAARHRRRPDRATELPFYGLDLDGVFLPDVPDAVYRADIAEAVLRRHGLEPFATLPFFSPERAVVITGRPDADRERTQAWLARWGHGALPLECRPSRSRTRRMRSRATRPRRRRAGAARISSKATPSRRCASRRTRRIWW